MKECTRLLTDEDVRQGKEGISCCWSPNYTDDCTVIRWDETPIECPFHKDNRLDSLSKE